ncbi:hypothetical protein D3C77_383780 [compost metagenome]
MNTITISTPYIKLDQFLKLSNCVPTGGMAKALLQDNAVTVNGQPEDRRGRKLYPGDMVEVEGSGTFQVASAQ